VTLRVAYRVQQFLAALRVRGPVPETELRPYLSAAQITLFRTMPATEQRHALAVLRTLEQRGYSHPSLAQAALLHDVGKVVTPPTGSERGRNIAIWHRVAVVLLKAVEPTLLERLALNETASWRFPFYVLVHHAERSAEMSAAAGTDPLAVALIRWHHTPPQDSDLDGYGRPLLAALRSADEHN
jgi:hypothetical protein